MKTAVFESSDSILIVFDDTKRFWLTKAEAACLTAQLQKLVPHIVHKAKS